MSKLARFSAALLIAACAPASEEPGPDAGQTSNERIVDISGKVQFHPLEVEWRTNAGTLGEAPSLAGVTVNIEDAVRAKAGLSPLKTVTSGADGSFTAEDVDVKIVTIAILASVQGAGLYYSGYGLQRGRPSADLVDMPVYVFSNAFIDTLVDGLTEDPAGFKATGFALGTIRTTGAQPLAGAKIARTSDPTNPFTGDETIGVLYPKDDFSGVRTEGDTGEKGLVLLTNAGDAKDYTAIKEGYEFEERLTGSRGDAVVSFFIGATSAP